MLENYTVHTLCRLAITRRLKVDACGGGDRPSTSRPSTRSLLENKFMFKSSCLFCGERFSDHPRDRDEIRDVMAFDFSASLRDTIKERHDAWALQVSQRLAAGFDLMAEEAKYHQRCKMNFMCKRSNKESPVDIKQGPAKRGRPLGSDVERLEAFNYAVQELIASETGVMRVTDMMEIMKQKNDEPYSYKYFCQMLDRNYGKTLVNESGIVTVRDRTAVFLREFYRQSKESDGIATILKTNAKVTREGIRRCEEFNNNDDFFPDLSNLDTVTMLQGW